jgi:hypothetical protein
MLEIIFKNLKIYFIEKIPWKSNITTPPNTSLFLMQWWGFFFSTQKSGVNVCYGFCFTVNKTSMVN